MRVSQNSFILGKFLIEGKLCEFERKNKKYKAMFIKLNQGYVAPETNHVSVALECGVCAVSKEQVVNGNNTSTTIEHQDGDSFVIGERD